MFGFSVVELKYDISCDQCKEKIYIVHDLKKKNAKSKKNCTISLKKKIENRLNILFWNLQ